MGLVKKSEVVKELGVTESWFEYRKQALNISAVKRGYYKKTDVYLIVNFDTKHEEKIKFVERIVYVNTNQVTQNWLLIESKMNYETN